MQRWTAPMATEPVDAVVPVPGSKSLTNRFLVLAALSEQPVEIDRPLRARDTELMAAALGTLGADIAESGSGWLVRPGPPGPGPVRVDCGLAGTVMRFVPPIATLHPDPAATARFDGDPRARQRPMGPVIRALRAIGALVDDGGRGALPITVGGGPGVRGGAVELDASTSSQFVSALLLTGARWPHGVAIRHDGPPLPSLPHLAMTVAALRRAGAVVLDDTPDRWEVGPGPLQLPDLTVEPDLAGAIAFFAAAIATGGRVTVPGLLPGTIQPAARLGEIFESIGATWVHERDGLTVTGSGRIRGLDADLRDVGELVPVIAALAALAEAPSRLRGIGHLRGHETDRIAALAKELDNLGADVTEAADGLTISPRPLRGGLFGTHQDHRLAHAGALLGLVTPGIELDDIGTTAKTMPDFAERWQAMLGLTAPESPSPESPSPKPPTTGSRP